MPVSENHPIVLFDGICNYCNGWVNFIIAHDKKRKFLFAPLQSDAGKKLLTDFNVQADTDSVVLIDKGNVYLKSTAGLRILKNLGGIYTFFFILIITPRFIRDFVYNIIARNRYKWWGKKEACMIPTKDIKDRFLN